MRLQLVAVAVDLAVASMFLPQDEEAVVEVAPTKTVAVASVEVDMKAEVVAPVVPAALVVLAGATQVLDSEAATGGTTAVAAVRRRLEIPAGDKGYPLRALRCFSSFRTGTYLAR
jgi:hypothetical protein